MFKTSSSRWFFCFLGLGLFLALLTVVFYRYVNWQGEKKWAEKVAELKAKGEPTDWRDVVPERVPDSENFCATPILACLFDYSKVKGDPEPVYADGILVDKIKNLKHDDPANYDIPLKKVNTLTDMKKWQEYYAKSKVFPHPKPSPKNTPATDVIFALNRYEKELNELIEASKRPKARFAVHYDEEPKMSIGLNNLGVSLNLGNLLSLRASAYLQSNQSAKAWDDLKVLLKFQQAAEKEPSLISHLVGITVTGMTLNKIWEGMALNAWSNDELEQISHRLAQLDFLDEYKLCMRGEIAFFTIPTLEYLKNKEDSTLADITGGDMGQAGRLISRAIPRGCFDMAKVASVKILHERMLPLIDEKNRRYDFANEALMKAEEYKSNPFLPEDIMLNLVLPSSRTSAQKMVEAQATVDMARIACALELFQRKNGRYPPTLDALKQPLPKDILTGEPYLYQQTPNGRYQLWSVGWNQTNDLGAIAYKDTGQKRTDPQKGDWVWLYPSEKVSP